MIKKYIFLFISIIFLLSCNQDDNLVYLIDNVPSDTSIYNFSDDDIIKGRIRVKLKEEPQGEVTVKSVLNNKVVIGLRSLDASATRLKIINIKRTFPYAGKYEERTKKEGLHLWYDIWFTEDIISTKAAEDVSILDEIEISVPIVKTKSYSESAMTYSTSNISQSPFLFNDPYLSKLWSYQNFGTEPWQSVNADIRLFDIWKTYNGHPDIIVSVVDGGIYSEHPDLLGNMWFNPNEIPDNGIDDDDNGYIDDVHGYNFVSNTGTITSHRHGTHVAGTIAAINNNNIGIAGIAGGDGTPNSGVKLMSCQIFEHPSGNYLRDVLSEDMGAAIKYGADNGAVISQNSWGYAIEGQVQSSYIDPAHKEAIDYFIKYAGCDNDGNQLPNSPMKGGIVLFAVGNMNSNNPKVSAPADYEKVIAVTAIGPNYKKATYSNYGEFVDISAPGGISNFESGIYSTTIAECGDYEYRYGTSMACPHVAGVAALIIEKNGIGKPGFTNAQLEEILLTTSYSVDLYNPDYIGMLGYGCVNTTAALQYNPSDTKPVQIINNPINNNILYFKINVFDLVGNATITIFNSTGSLVIKKTINTKRFKIVSVDISKLATGYYIFKYQCNNNMFEESIIKY